MCTHGLGVALNRSALLAKQTWRRGEGAPVQRAAATTGTRDYRGVVGVLVGWCESAHEGGAVRGAVGRLRAREGERARSDVETKGAGIFGAYASGARSM